MLNRSIRHRIGKWLAVAAMLGFGLAMAQSEPTLKQIYDAAQAGQVDKAQTMVQQVLVLHPNSARAHFVQAELFSRQGDLGRAREALATADKLAPGLPFAKSEAIQALRNQLAAKPGAPAAKNQMVNNSGSGSGSSQSARAPAATAPAAPAPSTPWTMILVLGAAVIAFAVFMLRKKAVAAPYASPSFTPQQPPYGGPAAVPPGAMSVGMPGGGMQNGLNGPQTFGMGAGGAAPGAQYPGAQSYGQQPYGQQPPAGGGMGGKLMGGLATGLAVGAGVMAAQAIGKNLMGKDEPAKSDGAANAHQQPAASEPNYAANNDMGGQNFGMDNSGSWDDGTSVADNGGGGDWDT